MSDEKKKKLQNKLKIGEGLAFEGLTEFEKTYSSKQKRIIDPQLNEQNLAEILGASGIIWIIEDFHKVKVEEKTKFSQMLKVFINAADRHPSVQIIAVGAVNSARQVIEYDLELSNRIQEIYIPLLVDKEIEEIIEKGTKILGTVFSSEIRNEIIKYSNNIAAICHQLCYNICDNLNIRKSPRKGFLIRIFGLDSRTPVLSLDSLKEAVTDYVNQNSDTFQKIIDRVINTKKGKYENAKLIVTAFVNSNKSSMYEKEILKEIHKVDMDYPKQNLTKYLDALCSSGMHDILRYNNDTNKYLFSNLIFKAYLLMQLESGLRSEFYSHKADQSEFINAMISKTPAFTKLKKTLKENK